MDTQNTCCECHCNSPYKLNFQEATLHPNCNCKCHQPKAVQSEVEISVEDLERITERGLWWLRLDRVRDIITTYQHRIEEARKEERETRDKEWVEQLVEHSKLDVIDALQILKKVEALTPKEPNDTEI